jgi:hypothetical protein
MKSLFLLLTTLLSLSMLSTKAKTAEPHLPGAKARRSGAFVNRAEGKKITATSHRSTRGRTDSTTTSAPVTSTSKRPVDIENIMDKGAMLENKGQQKVEAKKAAVQNKISTSKAAQQNP